MRSGNWRFPEAMIYKPAKLSDAELRVLPNVSLSRIRYGAASSRPCGRGGDCVCAYGKVRRQRLSPAFEGRGVPLGARIVAIADAFDMFISDRPHRRELAVRQARDEISRWSSFSFDPAVVEVSLRMPVSFDTGCSVG
jgi:hypothetical protein